MLLQPLSACVHSRAGLAARPAPVFASQRVRPRTLAARAESEPAGGGAENFPDALGRDPNFSVLSDLLEKTQLVKRLASGSSWTVFAPSDAAWKVTLDALGLSNPSRVASREVMEAILARHVVQGLVRGSDLQPGAEIRSLAGARLRVKRSLRPGSPLKVGGASLARTDIPAGKGLIHIVSDVLLPDELTARRYAVTLPGVIPAIGYFDPLNFTLGQTMNEVKRLREAEVTHARLAMAACAGILAQEAWHPLFPSIVGPAIIHWQQLPMPAAVAVIAVISAVELTRARLGWEPPTDASALFKLREDYEPGDLGFDPLNLHTMFKRGMPQARAAELALGRLAMLAAVAFVAEEVAFAAPVLTVTREVLIGPGAPM